MLLLKQLGYFPEPEANKKRKICAHKIYDSWFLACDVANAQTQTLNGGRKTKFNKRTVKPRAQLPVR